MFHIVQLQVMETHSSDGSFESLKPEPWALKSGVGRKDILKQEDYECVCAYYKKYHLYSMKRHNSWRVGCNWSHNHHFFHTERSNNISVLCIFDTAFQIHSNDSDRQKVLLFDSDVIPSRSQDKISAHLVYFQGSLWICSEEVPGDLQRRPIGGRGIAVNEILSIILHEHEIIRT